jgi:hypothetical protein
MELEQILLALSAFLALADLQALRVACSIARNSCGLAVERCFLQWFTTQKKQFWSLSIRGGVWQKVRVRELCEQHNSRAPVLLLTETLEHDDH